jgi:broad specificity phosphatase PhoE
VRAATTARIALAEGLELPVHIDERLRDRELGVLERLTPWGVRARFPEEAARIKRIGKFYYRPPGGESWTDVALRLRSIYRDLEHDHLGARVLVVAHDAIVVLTRYIVEHLSEQEILKIEETRIGNCSLSRWRRVDGGAGVAPRENTAGSGEAERSSASRRGRLGAAMRPVEYNDTAHLDALRV